MNFQILDEDVESAHKQYHLAIDNEKLLEMTRMIRQSTDQAERRKLLLQGKPLLEQLVKVIISISDRHKSSFLTEALKGAVYFLRLITELENEGQDRPITDAEIAELIKDLSIETKSDIDDVSPLSLSPPRDEEEEEKEVIPLGKEAVEFHQGLRSLKHTVNTKRQSRKVPYTSRTGQPLGRPMATSIYEPNPCPPYPILASSFPHPWVDEMGRLFYPALSIYDDAGDIWKEDWQNRTLAQRAACVNLDKLYFHRAPPFNRKTHLVFPPLIPDCTRIKRLSRLDNRMLDFQEVQVLYVSNDLSPGLYNSRLTYYCILRQVTASGQSLQSIKEDIEERYEKDKK